ncbi:MAG TPA: hypothetical protein VFW94_14420 [Candidatus Acidoferrales bacterium]|nr:hypothetical protein [Candidatus Acidoferrales bacterium]
MRKITVCTSAIVAAAFLPAISPGERITVKLPSEAGLSCSDLRVPKWRVPAYDRSLHYDLGSRGFERGVAQFEFREGKRLLVRIFAPPPPFKGPSFRLYSLDVYAIVSERGKTALEAATQAEWQAARTLPRSSNHAPGAPRNGQPFIFGGHTFSPSGRYWVGVTYVSTFMSTNKAYLALLSWDGIIKPGDFLEWERIDGRYFIDLYHVPSGRKLGTIQGRFHEAEPLSFASLSYWIDGPRFILPIAKDMRRFVVCEVQ